MLNRYEMHVYADIGGPCLVAKQGIARAMYIHKLARYLVHDCELEPLDIVDTRVYLEDEPVTDLCFIAMCLLPENKVRIKEIYQRHVLNYAMYMVKFGVPFHLTYGSKKKFISKINKGGFWPKNINKIAPWLYSKEPWYIFDPVDIDWCHRKFKC